MNQLFTDGGVIEKNPSPIGGTWAYRVVHDGTPIGGCAGVIEPRGPYPTISNNMTELLAIFKGLESLPDGWSGQVCSDSKIALGWVFWGYRRNKAVPILCERVDAAVKRLGELTPILHDGHPTAAQIALGKGKRGQPVSEHNVFVDRQCCRMAQEHQAKLLTQAG